ncbi:MAG: phospholipase [Parachlamydia sp.]|nr:MAG: phospholipase [Parachlamydia sp.]
MHTYQIVDQGKPLKQAAKALILLHGRGSTARDILSLADMFADDSFYIAAPQASRQSWYPYSFMEEEAQNEPWLTSAIETVKKLIEEIATHIPKDQIYLMGFSQGACLALETSARYATNYGGIVAFTGGLIGKTLDEKKYQGNFAETRVFIGTSDQDPHVPLVRSEQSKTLMEKMGANVTLKVYAGMAHTINQDEIDWVRKFIFKKI